MVPANLQSFLDLMQASLVVVPADLATKRGGRISISEWRAWRTDLDAELTLQFAAMLEANRVIAERQIAAALATNEGDG